MATTFYLQHPRAVHTVCSNQHKKGQTCQGARKSKIVFVVPLTINIGCTDLSQLYSTLYASHTNINLEQHLLGDRTISASLRPSVLCALREWFLLSLPALRQTSCSCKGSHKKTPNEHFKTKLYPSRPRKGSLYWPHIWHAGELCNSLTFQNSFNLLQLRSQLMAEELFNFLFLRR